MTEYLWGAILARAETLFGEPPGHDLEQRVLVHFERTPNRVVTLVEAIGRRVATGKVRSGWVILDLELATPHPERVATDDSERFKAAALVEMWIRHTGGGIPTWDELEDEVFGPRGRLHRWNEDLVLVERIKSYWLGLRQRFEAAEAASAAYQEAAGETYRRLRSSMRESSLSAVELDAHAARVAGEVGRAREAAARLAYFDEIELPTEETE